MNRLSAADYNRRVLQRVSPTALWEYSMPAITADRNVPTRRAYSLTKSQRAVYLVYAALGLGGGGYFLIESAAHPLGRPLSVPFGLSFLIPGLILALSALRSRLT